MSELGQRFNFILMHTESYERLFHSFYIYYRPLSNVSSMLVDFFLEVDNFIRRLFSAFSKLSLIFRTLKILLSTYSVKVIVKYSVIVFFDAFMYGIVTSSEINFVRHLKFFLRTLQICVGSQEARYGAS